MKIRRPKIKNPALIFTTASVVMTFGAAGLGVWVGMRTERARIAHKDENLTKMDFAKILWKEYVSLSLVALAGAGCAIASHRISARDIAKLATLATGSGAAFSKYRSKIREILGEEKEKEIFEQVKAKEDWAIYPNIVDSNSPEYDVMDTKYRLDLGVSELEPIEFYSNPLRVANALYAVNRDFILGRIVDVALLKDFLGLPDDKIDHKYFWIESAYYDLDLIPWIDFVIETKEGDVDEHGKQIRVITTRDTGPIDEEMLKKIESGEVYDQWQNCLLAD